MINKSNIIKKNGKEDGPRPSSLVKKKVSEIFAFIKINLFHLKKQKKNNFAYDQFNYTSSHPKKLILIYIF